MASGAESEILEIGVFRPQLVPVKQLGPGEVGYVATGLKSVRDCQVGDTMTSAARPAPAAAAGLQAGQAARLRRPLSRSSARTFPTCARRSRSSISTTPRSASSRRTRSRWAPASASASWACCTWRSSRSAWSASSTWISSRPRRPSSTASRSPTAAARSTSTTRRSCRPSGEIETIAEPWVKVSVITPEPVHRHAHGARDQPARHVLRRWSTSTPTACLLTFELPLAEVIVDFYDQLKSRTQGYASMDYEEIGYRAGDLVKLDVLVAGEPVDALSLIVHRDRAPRATGRALVDKLRELIPRQMFEVPVQAAIGSNVIARETIRGDAQERAGQVLRWRHHPQAQAAREAEGRQGAHEAGGQRRDPAGGIPGRAALERG